MTGSSRPKHAGRRPRASVHLTGGRVAIAVGVLALVLVVKIAVGGGGDDDPKEQTPVGAALTTYGADWRTKDGNAYRLTVTPIAELVTAASASGCVTAPGAQRTNLRFSVRIDNLSTDPAPVPEVAFAANLNAAGVPSPTSSFAQGSKNIDLGPRSGATDCVDASRIAAGGDEIGPKSAVTYTGLIGGVKTPVGAGVSLIVRYTRADAAAPGGTGTAVVVVDFPDLRTPS